LNKQLRDNVILKLKDILKSNGYIDVISDWICSNITTIDQHTLEFVDYVNKLAMEGATCEKETFK
jgi:hypothetical protein